jgi:hypothetical protein
VEGYRNYDKSEFEPTSLLFEDDSKIEKIWGMQHSLTQFLDLKYFKSYDELKHKLQMVLNSIPVQSIENEELEDPIQSIPPKSQVVTKSAVQKIPPKDISFEDDDESMSYFAKLANED